MVSTTGQRMRVADEVWVATALLHREHPDRTDFECVEIRDKAEQQRQVVSADYRGISAVYQHAIQHCVANRPRDTGRYRFLFATGKTTRRLFRSGDSWDQSRDRGPTLPHRHNLPEEYRHLLDWYSAEYNSAVSRSGSGDPILRLRGLGSSIWKDEDPDQYVNRLREGWA